MKQSFKKLAKNKKGFTLTEVLIGMMILTVAIVAGTSMLVGLIRSNRNIVSTMQAYYLAQEGIEIVRNIRDTNWLHNTNWIGDNNTAQWWGDNFEEGKTYSVAIKSAGWQGAPEGTVDNNQMSAYMPFLIEGEDKGEIFKYENGGEIYLSSDGQGQPEETGFKRYITILPYEGECNEELDECEDYVLVQSRIEWKDGARDREFVLETVLTDWKGGAL